MQNCFVSDCKMIILQYQKTEHFRFLVSFFLLFCYRCACNTSAVLIRLSSLLFKVLIIAKHNMAKCNHLWYFIICIEKSSCLLNSVYK